MADRQRLVIGNLAQYGMVEQVDGVDLPPNAFQLLKNMAFYKGRLGAAGRWGLLSSPTPIFGLDSHYYCCALWELYNSGVLKLKAGNFAEYENAAGTMYEIPCWLGLYGTVVNSTGVFTGNALDGNWSTVTFPRAPNKWLTTSDKIFLAPLATPELGKEFTDMGGQKFTVTGVSVYPTAGAVYHDEDSNSFTVGYSDTSGATKYVYAYSATVVTPHPASGTLTKDSGTGDATITYTAVTDVVTLKTYSDWTDSSTAILQADTTDPAGSPTADCAYNSTTTEGLAFNSGAIGHITNQFFTIRKIKLMGEGANASLIVRDNTTKRGYALQVEQTATPGSCYTFNVNRANWTTPPAKDDVYIRSSSLEYTVVGHTVTSNGTLVIYTEGTGDPALIPGGYNTIKRKTGYSGGQPYYQVSTVATTGPFTVTIRLWDGYFDSADSAVGVNATVVWEKTAIYDWGYSSYNDVYYEDLWMWWRDSFLTFGYGPNALGCMTISGTPETPRVGFALKNAYIAKATAGKNCIYSIDVAAGKAGPYGVSAVAATTLTITSPPADGDYLIWGCKKSLRKKIVTASDYVLFCNDADSDIFPTSIWHGGMTEESPLTNPAYEANFAYAANDITIYKGRVFLAGARKLILKANGSSGYSWVIGQNTPTLVKWSAAYAPAVWEDCYPSGTTADVYYLAGHIDFAETNGAVNAIGQLRDVLIVYKSDSIAMLSPTGIYNDPFQVDYMAWKIGVGAARAVAITPERHFFPTPDSIWQAEIGEVSKTPSRYSITDYGKVWVLPGESTMFAQAYYSGDTGNLCLAYNYDTNSVYYAELKNLVDITEHNNSVYAITQTGKYLYQTRETNIIPTSYICASPLSLSTQAVSAVLSMNDLLNNKTIYNVDIFTRYRGSGTGPFVATLKARVVADNTAEAAYTSIPGEIIGKAQPGFSTGANPIDDANVWRFRYHKILTGLTFQIDMQLDSDNLTHEIFRIEVDYEVNGQSKYTGS